MATQVAYSSLSDALVLRPRLNAQILRLRGDGAGRRLVGAAPYEAQPHFLYHGDDHPPLLDWIEATRRLWRCRSRFYDELCALEELHNPDARTCGGGGAYLRLEIVDLLAEHGIADPYILCTDCDVSIFRRDPEPYLQAQPCRFIACGPESMRSTPTDMNTGVLSHAHCPPA